MALSSTIVWEVRAGGDVDNGGGFKTGASGADYSQQDSAQESYTTLATSGVGVTTVTCGGGDTFDADIVGNLIRLVSGTNATAGWYEVTARNSATEIVIDSAPDDGGGGLASGVGNMGGAVFLSDTLLDNTALPGHLFYVKADAIHTMIEGISLTNDGSTSDPITLEGYNTTRGDEPTGDNRPLIACGANAFSPDDYFHIKNLRFTISEPGGVDLDNGAFISNIKVQNNSESDNREAVDFLGHVVGCELISDNGIALRIGTSRSSASENYIHDSDTGIFFSTDGSTNIKNIIANCEIGIDVNSAEDGFISHNIIYGCTTGISGTTGYNTFVINNILDNNTTGASWSTADINSNNFDYNVWNNDTDTSNATKGVNSISNDPKLVDPDNGDFRLQYESPAIEVANVVGIVNGLTKDITFNIGVDQNRRQFTWGAGTISQETGADARSGTSIKFDPSSQTRELGYRFYVPCTDSQGFQVKLYVKKSSSEANSTLTFSASGNGISAIDEDSISLTDTYSQYSSSTMTPTSTGFVEVILRAKDGSTTGDIFVDDITVEDV